MNNKAFREKVAAMEGAVLFLEAVGFQQKLLPHGGERGTPLVGHSCIIVERFVRASK